MVVFDAGKEGYNDLCRRWIIIQPLTEYRKRTNKRPGHLLGCPVGEEGEGAFIKTIYES